MKTLTKTTVKTAAMLTLGVMIAGSAIAKGDGDGNKRGRKQGGKDGGPKCGELAGKDMPGKEERTEFRKAQHEKIKAFHEERKENMEAAREAAKKEEDPYKVVATAKANHIKAHTDAVKFFGGMQAEGTAFMKSMFDKYDVPEEKQEKILEKAEEHREKRKEMHEKHNEKIMETLDKLADKDDLTKEDIHKALKKVHKGRPGHGKKGDRERGGKRGEKRGGKRGGDGDKERGEGRRNRDTD